LIYNIIVPPRWIEQNSKYLSFRSPIQIKKNPFETTSTILTDTLNIDLSEIDDNINNFSSDHSSSMSETSYSSILKNSIQSIKSTSSSHKICTDYELNGDIEMCNNINWYRSKSEDYGMIDSEKLLKKNKLFKAHSMSPLKSETLSFTTQNSELNISPTLKNISIDIRPVMITIQIPVYTEDFSETLINTFENIKMFIEYWNETHDSKANVLIHEDGLQKVNINERNKRLDYYDKFNNCFYVARQVEGRTGRFKKASNMNFGMRQILKINNMNNTNKHNEWEKLSEELNFMYNKKTASTFEIGKYILLIDSDSKFNPYAIEALIYEMEMSPKIGYLQVRTSSNKVLKNTWENVISHFTNSIYSINFLYACSNGFPAPLVGHNALLRWEALENVEKLINGYSKDRPPDSWQLWDESRVSEDFVMSIYLQYLGYYGKYIFYDCGFKEGVSLNVIDEITKLKKYIYGVNEIMFYPCNKWLTDGITSHLYANFLLSNKINFCTKYALLSYMGSYYSLALSPIVTCWYYFVKFFNITNSNLFVNDALDTVYACTFIFFGISVITNIIVKAKHKFIKNTIYDLIFKEIMYGLYLTMFYSCVSWHLLTMMSAFFLNFPAKWETTKKEAEKISITTLLLTYKWMYLFGTGFLILILYGLSSNGDYQNKDPKSVVPFLIMILSHMLLPIYTSLT